MNPDRPEGRPHSRTIVTTTTTESASPASRESSPAASERDLSATTLAKILVAVEERSRIGREQRMYLDRLAREAVPDRGRQTFYVGVPSHLKAPSMEAFCPSVLSLVSSRDTKGGGGGLWETGGKPVFQGRSKSR